MRKFSVMSWITANYGNVPWAEAAVDTGKILIDDLNINLVL